MKQIPLNGTNICARVDDADYELVSQYRWGRLVSINTDYAVAWINGTNVLMHRLIIGAKAGEKVDHIDLDGLNNCRKNLRLATHSQNMANRPKHWGKQKYKGVAFDNRNRTRKYIGQIKVEGKHLHLGCFVTAEEAAHAYDKAALEAYGQFAALNFPSESA